MLLFGVTDAAALTPEQEAALTAEHAQDMLGYLEGASSDLSLAKERAVEGAETIAQRSLIAALVAAKGVLKVATAVEKVLKDAVKSRWQPMSKGFPVNEKVFIDGDFKAKIELRPSRKVTFQPEVAAVLLKRKGLLEAAAVTTTTVTDPAALAAKLKEVQVFLMTAGNVDLAIDIGVLLKTATSTQTVLSEDKIGELVQADQLTITEAAAFYTEVVDHSVWDVTK